MTVEARGDDDDDVDDSGKRSSWDAGCGWRPALRTADAVKQNGEEEHIARTVWCEHDWQCNFVVSPYVCMSQEKGIASFGCRG